MELSLITTKLYIPQAPPQLVKRPRLLEKINTARQYKLTLVSAPAGFGKTTLLSGWVHSSRPPVPTAWLSLEQAENDPSRFWQYVIAALRTVIPGVGESTLALLRSPGMPTFETLLTSLINDLAGLAEDCCLVLDDYHFIQSEPVHVGVDFLLEHLPPRLHLVIATRADPPLPLARYRGKGILLWIGADDLRFTLEEAAELFAGLGAPALSPQDIAALNSRAEGWVVGLKMAMLSLKGEKDVPAFISGFTGSQRYIMDYLLEEVLQTQTPDIRDFLLKTSVLGRLSGPLCDAVAGVENSRKVLARLERENLFIVPLDAAREWYRYEHLFADLLRHRLELEQGKEKAAELQMRASRWFDDNGYCDEAIEYALVARAWPEALNLIEKRALEKERLGEVATLRNWISAVPRPVLLTRPYLYRQYIADLVPTGQLDAADAALEDLEPIAAKDENLRGEIALIRMHIARWRGDIPRAIEYGEEALSHLSENNLDLRGDANLTLGVMKNQTGQFDEAVERLTEAAEIGRRTGNLFVAGASLVYLSGWYVVLGQLHKALEITRQAVDLADQSPAAASPHAYLATLLYEWNDLDGAIAQLQQAAALNRYFGLVETEEFVYNHLARSLWARGDTAGALETLAKVDRIKDKARMVTVFRALTIATHVLFALRQGDIDTAREWLGRLPEKMDYMSLAQSSSVQLRIQIAFGEKAAAAESLRVLSESTPSKFAAAVVSIHILQALAADKPEDGVGFLAEAMALARPEGFIRTFVDEGMALAPVLRLAISRRIEPEYARKLLDIIEAEERQRKIRVGEIPAIAPAASLLSEREMEVLRLMAAGLSNQEIAAKLFISQNTTKTHLRHVFDKMEAKSRARAIARARELKLI